MAGWMACVSAIQQATGNAFDDDELEQILSDLQRRAEAIKGRAGGTLGDPAAFKQAAAELADENRAAAARAEARALLAEDEG